MLHQTQQELLNMTINDLDLLSYRDLKLQARFFNYTNNAQEGYSAISETRIPEGPSDRDSKIATQSPSTDIRWQTVRANWADIDWTSSSEAILRRATYRAILNRDNGLSIVLAEGVRSISNDAEKENATFNFAFVSKNISGGNSDQYHSTIDKIHFYNPPGTVHYNRLAVKLLAR